jgi:hypothetical protein
LLDRREHPLRIVRFDEGMIDLGFPRTDRREQQRAIR